MGELLAQRPPGAAQWDVSADVPWCSWERQFLQGEYES